MTLLVLTLLIIYIGPTDGARYFRMPVIREKYNMSTHLHFDHVIRACRSRYSICRSRDKNVCGVRFKDGVLEMKDFRNSCFMFMKNMCDNPGEEYYISWLDTCAKYKSSRRNEELVLPSDYEKDTNVDENNPENMPDNNESVTDNTQTTTDNSEDVTDNSQTPTEKYQTTNDNSEDVTDNSQTPTENYQTTNDNSEDVTDNSQTPIDNTQTMTDYTQTTTDNSDDAADNSQSPIDNNVDDNDSLNTATDNANDTVTTTDAVIETGDLNKPELPMQKLLLRLKTQTTKLVTLYSVDESFDGHSCPLSCPNVYSPVCVVANRGFGKYLKYMTFINHCLGDIYYCQHWQDFSPPPPEESGESDFPEMVTSSPLSWSYCGSTRYMQFARFSEVVYSMGHFGWLTGDYKPSHIMEPWQKMPGFG